METTFELSDFSASILEAAAGTYGTPLYIYSAERLRKQATAALGFPNAFGLTVRYAMKASPTRAILRLFDGLGLHIDASSGPEVRRALEAGIAAEKISLSSQELPIDFADLVKLGIKVNACSLEQLRRFGEAIPGGEVGLRFNPGAGSGGNNRTNVGGISSSFGIWHNLQDEVQALLQRHQLRAVRIHTHIGSGSDPVIWQKVAGMSLDLVRNFPEVTVLNLGGGYKVARVANEKGTDLQVVGEPVKTLFEKFAIETGRQLHLEIEPGTFLAANAGAVLARIQDRASTGEGGYAFLKLDCGMTEILRPSLYGSQHPIYLLRGGEWLEGETRPYIIAGHCCESGDILTPAAGDPELLQARDLPQAQIGDLCFIGGAGAYCAGMATKHYNSFPEAAELMLESDGGLRLIRRRQALEQLWQNEIE
jgi:diaminopimelate decarboxylase